MKNFTILLCLLFLFLSASVSAQFTSTPVTIAMLNEPYIYDADANGATTYTLNEGLPGMTIIPSTGVVSFTPANQISGKVVISTDNGFTQSYYLYVSEGLACLPTAISYWNFDESIGSDYKDVYGNHDISAAATEPFDITGKVNRGKDVPKTNNTGIIIPDHEDFHFGAGESFTISFWFKSDILDRAGLTSNIGVIFGRNEGPGKNHWWIGVNELNEVTFLVRDSNYPEGHINAYLSGNRLYNKTDWHHIVCVRDAVLNKIMIYFDGVLPADAGASRNYPGSREFFGATVATDLSVGYLKPVGTEANYPMNGSIDELIVLSSALTAQQINELYVKGNSENPACEPGNYAPAFVTDPLTVVNEKEAYSYTAEVNDLENDVIEFTVVKPVWLTYEIVGNTVEFSGTPAQADVGTETVTIVASDNSAQAAQTFQLEVVNVNDIPVITSSPVTQIDEDVEYSYSITTSDADGDAVTLSAVTIPEWLTLDAANKRLYGTPTNDQVGLATSASFIVKLKASDATPSDSTQTFVITVNNINDAPVIVAQNDTLTTYIDSTLVLEIDLFDIEDVDNNVETLSLIIKPGEGYELEGDSAIVVNSDAIDSIIVQVAVTDGVAESEIFEAYVDLDVIVGLKGNLERTDINYFPNPSSEKVYFNLSNLKAFKFVLYDVSGNIVRSKIIEPNTSRFELDVRNLTSGMYTFVFHNNEHYSTGKISVIR